MPFPPRPIDATLHGVTDYTVGATLLTVFPRLADINGTESARQARLAGAFHAGYSTLTDYPLGAGVRTTAGNCRTPTRRPDPRVRPRRASSGVRCAACFPPGHSSRARRPGPS